MNELRYQLDLLKAMNQKLSEKERMYRLICETSDAAYLYYSFEKNEFTTLGKWNDFFESTDRGGRDIRDFEQVFDLVDEAYVMPLRDILYLEKNGESQASLECMQKNKKVWLHVNCHVQYENGQPLDKLITIKNITKQKFQNEELLYMAYYDAMTGLYNRNYFVSLLGEFVRKAYENNTIVSLLMIDIDDFKYVKDGMGMVAGDELVQMFGMFLKDFSSENVIVSHMSSDVYCVAIYDPIAGLNDANSVIHAIKKRIKEPFYLSSGQALNITVSIGVAEYPESASSTLELINCAEIVLFKGKNKGKNTVSYFDAPILNEFLHAVEIENKLKEAVHENNFLLYFQPQYYSGSKHLRGVEVLLRWRDKDGKIISPATFIPIAEKNGTIIPIGHWVVQESIKTYAQWKKQYGVHFVLSINISALQYSEDDFVDNLIETINKYEINPNEIELEITESVLIDDFDSVNEKLKVLRDYGIRISLDDFGTGFSSLSYLKQLPINTLKIDKSFVDTVMSDSATRVITESLINMVKALGLESIAEGVEEEQQYKYLHAIGCDMIQGYLMGKPMPPEDLESMFKHM